MLFKYPTRGLHELKHNSGVDACVQELTTCLLRLALRGNGLQHPSVCTSDCTHIGMYWELSRYGDI